MLLGNPQNEELVAAESCGPSVFLSSVFKEDLTQGLIDQPLRRRIIEDRDSLLPVNLLFWPQGSAPQDLEADTIIDRCFDSIRKCDLFVFLIAKRHGTGIDYFRERARVSYLELELLAASLLRKPILVLHLRGYDPEPELHDSLVLLRRALSEWYFVDDEDGLYGHFRAACALLASGTWRPDTTVIGAHLPEWLSYRRTRSDLDADLSNPRLLFLDGELQGRKRDPDLDRAKLLLDQVASGMRIKDGRQQVMPQGVALFRLWAAMRELMTDAGFSLGDPTAAVLWDRVFGLWASKASWFGLHAHVWMGPLAAVNSQVMLRRNFAAEPRFAQAQDVREPTGARASAIYSVAQRMHTRQRKLDHYQQTIALATEAVERDSDAGAGSLSIRGHALMQMAKLGHGWKLWEATADFKRALDLREQSAKSEASLGEAKVDLGFSLVLNGRIWSGFALLQEGVDLMRNDQSANGQAALARELRKLEQAAQITFRRKTAEAARRERLKIVTEVEAMDQGSERL